MIVKNRMPNEPKNSAPAITNQRFGWEMFMAYDCIREEKKIAHAIAEYTMVSYFAINETVICSTVTCANDHHHTHFVAPTLIAKSHGWCILSTSSLFDIFQINSIQTRQQQKYCKQCKKMQNTRRKNEMVKKIAKKIQKSAFGIENCFSLSLRNLFLHSLHSAVHSFNRTYFVNSAGLKMILIFFSLSFVLFSRSQSISILCYSRLCNYFIRFTLMTVEPKRRRRCVYKFVFLPQFVSVFNFKFAKCIRFQSILSSISR